MLNRNRVSRLDIKSGRYTEYMLPRPTNIRPRLYGRFEEPRHALDRQQPTARRSSRSNRSTRFDGWAPGLSSKPTLGRRMKRILACVSRRLPGSL